MVAARCSVCGRPGPDRGGAHALPAGRHARDVLRRLDRTPARDDRRGARRICQSLQSLHDADPAELCTKLVHALVGDNRSTTMSRCWWCGDWPEPPPRRLPRKTRDAQTTGPQAMSNSSMRPVISSSRSAPGWGDRSRTRESGASDLRARISDRSPLESMKETLPRSMARDSRVPPAISSTARSNDCAACASSSPPRTRRTLKPLGDDLQLERQLVAQLHHTSRTWLHRSTGRAKL